MITEMQVLEKLREIIGSDLNDHFQAAGNITSLDPISEDNIEIDYPDVDSPRKDSMFYIQPDYENLEPLSVHSDLSTLTATIYILCKGAKQSTLIERNFALFTALYSLLRSDPSLEGFIEASRITDLDYYPAVTASRTMTAIEVKLELQWSRTFR